MRRKYDIFKENVNAVTIHELWKFFGIVLTAAAFLDSSSLFWWNDAAQIF